MANKGLREIMLEQYGHIAFNTNENVKREYAIKLFNHLSKVKKSNEVKRIIKAYLKNIKSDLNE